MFFVLSQAWDQKKKLVEWKALIDTVGIESANQWKINFCS